MIVTFTVGGRAEYLRDVLAAWSQVRGAQNAEFVFHVEPGQPAAEQVIRDFTGAFRTTLVRNEERLGVLGNPHSALTRAFGSSFAGFVILAEEDVLPSDDVLEYFSFCAGRYASDAEIAAVCAHQIRSPQGFPSEIFRLSWFSPVLWGTWFSRWDEYIRDTWDFTYERKGWDAALLQEMRARGKRAIFPGLSRSQHIGKNGGAHCSPSFFPQTQSQSWFRHYERSGYTEVDPPADAHEEK